MHTRVCSRNEANVPKNRNAEEPWNHSKEKEKSFPLASESPWRSWNIECVTNRKEDGCFKPHSCSKGNIINLGKGCPQRWEGFVIKSRLQLNLTRGFKRCYWSSAFKMNQSLFVQSLGVRWDQEPVLEIPAASSGKEMEQSTETVTKIIKNHQKSSEIIKNHHKRGKEWEPKPTEQQDNFQMYRKEDRNYLLSLFYIYKLGVMDWN